jgi:hypothetical protein
MSSGAALRAAFGDFYRQSWRLFILNAALSACLVPVVVVGLWAPIAWALLLFAGPLVAALMHCAVVVTSTGELRLGDGLVGLRLHWRRGLLLGALVAGVALLSANAISYYAGSSALFLAVLGVYLALFFGAFQAILWPLAIAERARPVRAVAEDAGRALLHRPVQALVLCAALALVNLAGLAAALLPFLTVTIAYSFLAAARFALPPPTQEATD